MTCSSIDAIFSTFGFLIKFKFSVSTFEDHTNTLGWIKNSLKIWHRVVSINSGSFVNFNHLTSLHWSQTLLDDDLDLSTQFSGKKRHFSVFSHIVAHIIKKVSVKQKLCLCFVDQ